MPKIYNQLPIIDFNNNNKGINTSSVDAQKLCTVLLDKLECYFPIFLKERLNMHLLELVNGNITDNIDISVWTPNDTLRTDSVIKHGIACSVFESIKDLAYPEERLYFKKEVNICNDQIITNFKIRDITLTTTNQAFTLSPNRTGDVSNYNFSHSTIQNSDLSNFSGVNVNMSDCLIINCNMRNAHLTNSNLSNSILINIQCRNSNYLACDCNKITFSNCHFENTSFSESTLPGAYITDNVFIKSSFDKTILSDAIVTQNKFIDCSIHTENIHQNIFRGNEITQAK